MHINQFAIYRADQSTLQGRKLWHHTMEHIREKKLSLRIEYYKQEMIAGLIAKDEAVPKIRERFQSQIEVSDVLVINRDGEVSCYFMDKEHVVALSGFIRINPSGAVIRSDTMDYKIAERDGNWMTTDDIIIDGKQYYLLEHQEFRHDAPAVIMDAYGKMVMEECVNGFDETAKQRIRDAMKPPEVVPAVASWNPGKMAPFLKRMENWQKCYENGEYLRSAESGTEANYDMIDGLVNNSVKSKDKVPERATESPQEVNPEPVKANSNRADKPRRKVSVIKKLREKQVAIAVRDGKPVPKYLQQAISQERSRR
ncbi:MAG: DUF4316 domain-containing protein [Eubacteriales bacterium]|nr:DUF4316 domain-containing protein [Eubacteriales bacterium]